MKKPFKTIDEQLDILKSRHLTIDNEQLARKVLQTYGYYEIVNGYKIFLLKESETDIFKDGETFSHLYSLYELDKNIRDAVLKATLEIELSLRTAIAYTIAEDFGEEQTNYLNPRHYRRGKKRVNSNQYPLYQLLKKLDNISNDNIEPYKHYRDCHGNIPPWILLKGTSFGNLVTFFKLLKPDQKAKVIAMCTSVPINYISESVKNLFIDSLQLIHSYRNRAAHSGRLFNYRSAKTMRYNEVLHKQLMNITENDYQNGIGQTGLYTLQNILLLFKNEQAIHSLKFYVYYFINEHCQKYSNDFQLLCDSTMIDKNNMEKEITNLLKNISPQK
ncbi:Abi family protein [Streptococcus sp. zg-JUN1979]|uniref:Abi family protein n=1 Tax=Streptococcus sp. zg-JUN1979 TaxID=3391450 RepID=UPI0039A61593